MKEHKKGNGAPAPAGKDLPEPRDSADEAALTTGGTWGKGSATALERLRRNDYRGHPGEPDIDHPASG